MEKSFFQVVSVEEFLDKLMEFSPLERKRETEIKDCHNLVLSQHVKACEDLPPFSRSSMDGYAVKASDTFGASEFNPVYLKLTGEVEIHSLPNFEIEAGQCALIVTGAGIPPGADSVVMVEYTQKVSPDEIEIRRSVAPNENVMLQGEDCSSGDTILIAGTKLRPQDIGLLAALGHSQVEVYERPKVGIISTGDEIIDIKQIPAPGQIRDVNSYTLQAWISLAGGEPILYGIVPDNLYELKKVLQKSVDDCDVVFISGGSSVGSRDLTLQALEELPGGDVLLHGVALNPGKPTILAKVGKKPILGLPGQVTSAQVVMFVLAAPFIRHLSGEIDTFANRPNAQLPALLAKNIASKQGREDYVRVKLQYQEDNVPLAHPVLGKSGLLKTMLQADGFVRLPSSSEGLLKDSKVTVWLL